ncbi:MAG: universal stress protein [Crocinitomicaceae bacterium]
MEQEPLYLIPFDFTPVSEAALRLGLDLAEANKGKVLILHVAKKPAEKAEAKKKFKTLISKLETKEQAFTTSKVLIGDIFADIAKASELLDVTLIVMGTHGAKGFQKIFGSHAVKMISSSACPFLITQGKKEIDKLKTIVMPFSFEKKTIQIASFASKMAKQFKATVHLVGYHDKDEWLEKHMKQNQMLVKNHLEGNGVSCVIANIEMGSNYEKELMKYAESVDADIMAAGYFQGGIITNPNSFIQSMIENKLNLPLLTLNAEELTVSTGNLVTSF